MKNSDSLQRFIFENENVRGEIVHLDQSFEKILLQRNYPPLVKKLLGEALVASVLMRGLIKLKGQLTVQFQGVGPVEMLVAKCDHNYHVRGLAKFDESLLKTWDPASPLIGDGNLVVTIQQDDAKTYQSVIPQNHQSIAASLEDYFAQSEQIATRIWLSAGAESAAGVLLQMLPEAKSIQREHFWEHAVKLGETITDQELLTLENETVLHRLYHQETIRLFDPELIMFKCTCTRERMEDAVKMLGEKDANDLIKDKQVIAVTCEYCNNEFTFDKVDVAKIFFDSEKSSKN